MAKDIKQQREDMLLKVYMKSDTLAAQGEYADWKKTDEGKAAAAEILKQTQTKAGKAVGFLTSDSFNSILNTVNDSVKTVKGGRGTGNTNERIPESQMYKDNAKKKKILGMHPLTFGVVTFSVVAIGGVFVWYKFIRK